MVNIEGGTFYMGEISEPSVAYQVTLDTFSIGKYEVTQEEWLAVMGKNPSHFEGGKRPVENVSWNDCQEFIRKLNELTGKRFRLSTESELEYAAKGGNRRNGYMYSGSNNLGRVAWYEKNSNNTTHDVGQKRPNELGLYDMGGNVAEWCLDWFVKNEEYFNNSSEPLVNPAIMKEPPTRRLYNSDKTDYYDDKPEKSLRGGAYYLSIDKVNQRSCMPPNREDHEHGFRLVKVVRQK